MTQVAINEQVGTWSTFSAQISGKEMKVFEAAFKDFVGVGYTPLAVASQLVSGTNYRFFCNAKGVYPGALNQGAMVQIYAPLDATPHIVSIHICE